MKELQSKREQLADSDILWENSKRHLIIEAIFSLFDSKAYLCRSLYSMHFRCWSSKYLKSKTSDLESSETY